MFLIKAVNLDTGKVEVLDKVKTRQEAMAIIKEMRPRREKNDPWVIGIDTEQ